MTDDQYFAKESREFDIFGPNEEDERPTSPRAERCICGGIPWFEVLNAGNAEIKVVCKCGREGPASLWADDAVEEWNKMEEE